VRYRCVPDNFFAAKPFASHLTPEAASTIAKSLVTTFIRQFRKKSSDSDSQSEDVNVKSRQT